MKRRVRLALEGEATIDGSTCIVIGGLQLPHIVPLKDGAGNVIGKATNFKRDKENFIVATLDTEKAWPPGVYPALHVADVKIGVAGDFEWDRTIQSATISAVGFGNDPAWEKLK